MKLETYRFKLGAFNCLAVCDGVFTYPAPAFFANARKEEYEAELKRRRFPLEQITTSYNCLYLDTGTHRVLVDSGAGKLAPTTGRLLGHLRNQGIEPADIDTVILTHAHADHIGGNLDPQGGLAFPNARYLMSKTEWNFWTSKPDLSTLNCSEHLKQVLRQFVEEMLPPIQPRLELVDGQGEEIIPGIHTIAAPGHTPGHLALEISSQGETFINGVDTILHPIQIDRPEWYSVVDIEPEKTVTSRRYLLERAADTGEAVMLFHFPFPGLGHFARSKSGFEWKPFTSPTGLDRSSIADSLS